ncbi:hypothetical protein TDB9533_01637 [Thalassocella blandensis]|nr:hypothetical protein TDB9533_01637 [Thalassocella blandensis]
MKKPIDASLCQQRAQYLWFSPLTTRWMDNDIYGHINNAHYYSYFDTIANTYLIRECGLNIQRDAVVAFVVQSQCTYLSPLVFPQTLDCGFRVNHIGNSSVTYGLALFQQHAEKASAYGSFTHVFVERESDRPHPIPDTIRQGLERVYFTSPS